MTYDNLLTTIKDLRSSPEEKEDCVNAILQDIPLKDVPSFLSSLPSIWRDLSLARQTKIIKIYFDLITIKTTTSSPKNNKDSEYTFDSVLSLIDSLLLLYSSKKMLCLELSTRKIQLLLKTKKYKECLNSISSLLLILKKHDDKTNQINLHVYESIAYYETRNKPKAKSSLTSARALAVQTFCRQKVQGMIDKLNGMYLCDDFNYESGFVYFMEALDNFLIDRKENMKNIRNFGGGSKNLGNDKRFNNINNNSSIQSDGSTNSINIKEGSISNNLDNMSCVSNKSRYKNISNTGYNSDIQYEEDDESLSVCRYLILTKIMSKKYNETESFIKKLELKTEKLSECISKLNLNLNLKLKQDRIIKILLEINRACIDKNISIYNNIIRNNEYRKILSEDNFLLTHLDSLYQDLLVSNILKIVKPYSVIKIEYITSKLNNSSEKRNNKNIDQQFNDDITFRETEDTIRKIIIDKKIDGVIDHSKSILIINKENLVSERDREKFKLVSNTIDDLIGYVEYYDD